MQIPGEFSYDSIGCGGKMRPRPFLFNTLLYIALSCCEHLGYANCMIQELITAIQSQQRY